LRLTSLEQVGAAQGGLNLHDRFILHVRANQLSVSAKSLETRRDGEGGISAEVLGNFVILVSLDDRKQNPTPELGTIVVVTQQHGPLQIAVLVEQEQ